MAQVPAVQPGTTEAASTGAEESYSGPLIDEEIASIWGDHGYQRPADPEGGGAATELPAAGEGEAGAPPAGATSVSPETPESGTPATEGAEHAGEAPAAAATGDAEDDPFKDATPLTYVVNGETRTNDWITKLGDRGAVIEPENLAKVAQRLSERDHLYEERQANYDARTQAEARVAEYSKLTSWDTGQKTAQGQPIILSGREGAEAQGYAYAELFATQQVMRELLSDPARIIGLLTQDRNPDGTPKVGADGLPIPVLDKEAFRILNLEIQNAKNANRERIRKFYSSVPAGTSASSPAPAGAHQTSGMASLSDDQVGQLATASVKSIAQELGLAGLTPEDEQFLATAIRPYLRDTTEADRRATPGAGPYVVDNRFAAIMKDRHGMRQQLVAAKGQAREVATTLPKQNASNAARMAAAALNKTGARPATPAKTVARSDEEFDRETAQAEAFAARMRAAAALIPG